MTCGPEVRRVRIDITGEGGDQTVGTVGRVAGKLITDGPAQAPRMPLSLLRVSVVAMPLRPKLIVAPDRG